jgi:hypothetical protein
VRPSLIIPRLRASCPIFSGRVAGAADFAAASLADDVPVPYAFVLPGGDVPGEQELIGQALQQLQDRFTVAVCVSNTSDERGQAGAEQLHDIRAELLTALLGWSPAAEFGPTSYLGSDGDPTIDRARIWHAFDFACSTHLSG